MLIKDFEGEKNERFFSFSFTFGTWRIVGFKIGRLADSVGSWWSVLAVAATVAIGHTVPQTARSIDQRR